MKNRGFFYWLKKLIFICLCLVVIGSAIVYGVQGYVDRSARPYIINAETAPSADAVIILGASVYENGQPSPVLADRLDYGYRLYELGKVKKILVSGDHGTEYYDEVNTMKNYLLKKGVPTADIFMDHAGFNTYDSMYRAKHIFGIKTLLISTQNFHINRSIYIARKLGMDAYGFPSPDKVAYKMEYTNFRESLAKVKAVFEVKTHHKPKFLGKLIPIDGDGSKTNDKEQQYQ